MSSIIPLPCDELSASSCSKRPCPNQKGTLTSTILGSSLAFIVGSVINVALPFMQADFATNAAGAQWIVNAYLLPLGALVLLGGALGDHYGRKKIFLLGLLIFTSATLGCALAPSLELLLTARALQGVGGALLAPNSLAIIAASFTGADRAKAIGTWAAAGAIAGAVAPVLGGWILDTLNWRWAFGMILPPALATFLVARHAIVESTENTANAAPLDWAGAGLITLGLAALVWGLIAFPERGIQDPLVITTLAFAALAIISFLLVESRKADTAMMPLKLFSTSSFSGVSLLTLFLYAAMGGLFVLLPYMLIATFNFSATAAGAAMLPFPLIIGSLSRPFSGYAEKIGMRLTLSGGSFTVAIGFVLLSLVPEQNISYWQHLFPALLIMALGMAASVAPLTAVVMNSVDEKFVGVASGINNAIARCAGLIATALLGLVLLDANASGDASALISGFSQAALVGAGLALMSSLSAIALVRDS